MTDPTPTRDEAVPFPAYGELPFAELGSAVKAAQYGAPEPYPFDPEFFPGHQVFGPINFNSLNRIVTWFVKRALASAPAPASGRVDAVRDALEPFAKAIIPDSDTICGWRFGTTPKHEDFVRAHEVYAASLSPAATPVSEAELVAWRSNTKGGEFFDHPLGCFAAIQQPHHPGRFLACRDGVTIDGLSYPTLDAAKHAIVAALAKPASSPAGGGVREALVDLEAYCSGGYDDGRPPPRRDIALGNARAALSQSTSAGRVGE